MTSLLQFPNMESIPFKNLFSDFFYRLSISFNRVETSSFAHPVHIFCDLSIVIVSFVM
jgi:hypothetical protein